MYNATTNPVRLENSRKLLDYIYSQIPNTKGCMENIAKEGGCGAWCCQLQNPQVLYSEFLLTWHHIQDSWTDNDIASLIEACLNNYFKDTYVKGCVFWDQETKLCSQHETRPFNCRTYGIIPEEEWKPRYERLKVIYPDTKPQCGLVSTEDDSKVTKKEMDYWWKQMRGAERALGIKDELINDEPQGSYRTYHDHVLLHILGEDGLITLSDVRELGSVEGKKECISNLMSAFWSYQKDLRDCGHDGN